MKKIEWLVISSLLIIIGCGAVFGYWLLYPYKVFRFESVTNHILTPIVHPGDVVQWRTTVTQLTDGKRVDVSKQMVDGIVIPFSPSFYITKRGKQDFINASVIVPPYTPKGRYKIVIYNNVHVNPIRTIEVVRETEEFEVQ